MKQIFSSLKTGTLVVTLGLGSWTTASAEPMNMDMIKPDSVRLNLNWSFPRSDDNWDGGFGLTAQAIYPAKFIPEEYGKYEWAVSLGTSSWDVNEDSGLGINGNTARLEGDARSINLGGSFIRTDLLNNFELTSEVGLIYSSISADVNLVYPSAITQEVDIDDAFLGLLAVDLKYQANEDLTVFGGIGYQFDISKGDATTSTDSEENTMNAFFLRGGVHF